MVENKPSIYIYLTPLTDMRPRYKHLDRHPDYHTNVMSDVPCTCSFAIIWCYPHRIIGDKVNLTQTSKVTC